MTVPQHHSQAFQPPAGDSDSDMAIKTVVSARAHLPADKGQCYMTCMRAPRWVHGIRQLYAKRLEVGGGVHGDNIFAFAVMIFDSTSTVGVLSCTTRNDPRIAGSD